MSFLFFYPRMRVFDDNGEPLSGAVAKFFESETDIPTPVYGDGALDNELGVEVSANAAGVFPAIYGDPSVVYRMQLYTLEGVLVSDDDPIHPHVAFPAGTLMMFYGTAENRDARYPPALWELCDGDNGTPDARDRSPLGVSNTKPFPSTGGAVGSVNTASAGSHSHSGNTGAVILTGAMMPVHTHRIFAANKNSADNADGWGKVGTRGIPGEDVGPFAYRLNSDSGDQILESAGTVSPDGHAHTIGADGSHVHSVPAAQSPYFTTWFLMRKE